MNETSQTLIEIAQKRLTYVNSRLKRIRSKSFQKLLQFYYKSYISETLAHHGKRTAKIHPGLQTTKDELNCDHKTALDYLNAIEIIRKLFVETEIEYVKSIGKKSISNDELIIMTKVFTDLIYEGVRSDSVIRGRPIIEKRREYISKHLSYLFKETLKETNSYQKIFTADQVLIVLQEFNKVQL